MSLWWFGPTEAGEVENGAATVPPSAAGTFAFTGAATGRAPATAAGMFAFTGAASGRASATAAGTFTFTGSATGRGSAQAAGTFVFAGAASGRGFMDVVRFRTPQASAGPIGWGRAFYFYPSSEGVSLLVDGAVVTEKRGFVGDAEVEAADTVYLGGHEYVLTDPERVILEAAGYGAYVTVSTVEV